MFSQSLFLESAWNISLKEFWKYAQDLGEDLTDDEIQHIFNKADLDDDGFVTQEDFYNIMTHRVYWDRKV